MTNYQTNITSQEAQHAPLQNKATIPEKKISKLKSGTDNDDETSINQDNTYRRRSNNSRYNTKKKQIRSTTLTTRKRNKSSPLNRCRSASTRRSHSKHIDNECSSKEKYYYSIEKQYNYFLKKEEELRKNQEKSQLHT